jgi:hypothetical protein
MKIALTICSINYLAQAKTFGQSLLQNNPDYTVIVGLVDKINEKNDFLDTFPFKIIEVEKIGIASFDAMYSKYNLTELNTAVKPFFIQYLFENNSEISTVVYFDPDIFVYNKFEELENQLNDHDIVITPHITSPITDGFVPNEKDFLNTGLFNLGFIAVKRSQNSLDFLDWWMMRLREYCFMDIKNGLFVDQLWINLVPIFFKKVYILNHPGYNMAYWNLHERKITLSNNALGVNDSYPLVFFHFSGYKINKKHSISSYQNRYSFIQRPDLTPLFKEYATCLEKNKHQDFLNIPCFYANTNQSSKSTNHKSSNKGSSLKQLFLKILNVVSFYTRK